MRVRTALIISAVIIVGMFVFERIMMAQVDKWAERVTEISPTERLLAGLAFFWGHFWWMAAPAVVGSLLLICVMTDRSEGTSGS